LTEQLLHDETISGDMVCRIAVGEVVHADQKTALPT